MNKALFFITVFSLSVFMNACEITPEGEVFAKKLDAFEVESKWLPGERVYWESGRPKDDLPGKTHCSAFAAAVCKSFDAYILRPPEHRASFLANAQADWLEEKGPEYGWTEMKDPYEVQQAANKGVLILAVFKAPRSDLHGHIAIVRPSDKSAEKINQEGPQIIQAGMENHNSASLKDGFKHHKGSWLDAKNFKVRFYRYSATDKKK